jgi:hypothetical protein
MELVTALLLPILLIELYTWLPVISEWVLEVNVRRLCVEDREQFREDWKANLDAFPNTLVKLIHALSYTAAASRINKEFYEDKLYEISQHLKSLSDTHHLTVHHLQEIQMDLIEGQRKISEFELSLQKKVAILGMAATPTPELRDRATEMFHKLGHAYLGAFNRATSLINIMVDNHHAKFDRVERSIQLVKKKHCDATKLLFAGWRSSKISAYLKDLKDNASSLRSVVENERECEENDEYKKKLDNVTAAITRATLRLQHSTSDLR